MLTNIRNKQRKQVKVEKKEKNSGGKKESLFMRTVGLCEQTKTSITTAVKSGATKGQSFSHYTDRTSSHDLRLPGASEELRVTSPILFHHTQTDRLSGNEAWLQMPSADHGGSKGQACHWTGVSGVNGHRDNHQSHSLCSIWMLSSTKLDLATCVPETTGHFCH